MIGKLARAANGTPLDGKQALRERIDQLHEQAKMLERRAVLLEVLLAALPDLAVEADTALALLVTESNR